MKRNPAFASALARIRAEQGFPSAYSFYKTCGGQRALGLAFANYHNFERGKSLPQPFRVKRLFTALGLAEHAPKARELARAYLVSYLGSEDMLDLLGSTAPTEDLTQAAAQQALAQRKVRLTLEQCAAFVHDAATAACHTVLINTPGWMEIGELAQATKLKPDAARKAVKGLCAARLAEVEGSRARSLLAGKCVFDPPPSPASAAWLSKAAAYRKAWAEKARTVRASTITVRLPLAAIDRYMRHLSEAVSLAAVYGDVPKSPDTAIFLVEAKIHEIFS